MDRKAWIAIILSVAALIGWQVYSSRDYQKRLHEYNQAKSAAKAKAEAEGNVDGAASVPAATPTTGTGTATEATLSSGRPNIQPTPVVEKVNEELFTVKSPVASYTFTNLGGGLREIELFHHVVDNVGRKPVKLNAFERAPIASLAEISGDTGEVAYVRQPSTEAGKVRYERVTSSGLRIVKEYTINLGEGIENEYRYSLELSLQNAGGEKIQFPALYLNLGASAPVHPQDQAIYTGLNYFGDGFKMIDVNWFLPGKIPLIGIQTSGAKSSYQQEVKPLNWAAVKNQYFSTIATLPEAVEAAVWGRRFEVAFPEEKKTFGAIEGSVVLPALSLAPGESKSYKVDFYSGPNQHRRLTKLGDTQDKVLKYGMFKVVSLTLLNGLNLLHKFFGNYGIAVLVLTLVIKTLLWPLQNTATKSMRKMSALSPKMTEIRTKYKDDPQRMNTEVMKLYKDYGVNPFGGCLPMLIQIPIFFGFYSMLGTAVELRNSSFLWVNDLSQPDTVLRIAGLPLNILPLLMAATMLWQMSLTPKTGDAVQQRIFMFMPLIFVIFCYNFASALALYWTAQNLFSVVQLYLTRDKPIPPLKKVEAAELPGGKKKPRRKA